MPTKPSRPGVAFWATVLLVVGVLYVASSGPARMVGVHHERSATWRNRDGSPIFQEVRSAWWRRLHLPLVYASDRRWGEFLYRYWILFPVREA